MAASALLLGIDGGGTRCRARLEGMGAQYAGVRGEGVAGPANPHQDFNAAVASIAEAAAAALAAAELPRDAMTELVVVAGLAGVNIPAYRTAMLAWPHPFRRFTVCTDLHIANVGAHGGGDGALIITGTGCAGVASVGGVELLLGGYGFPHADQGSGAWLGLEAVRAVLLATDGLGPDTRLREVLEGQLGGSGVALVEAIARGRSVEFARLAPLVFDQARAGDAVAVALVAAAADYLSRMAERFIVAGAARVAFVGGLAEPITPFLSDLVQAHQVAPVAEPVAGAVELARRAADPDPR